MKCTDSIHRFFDKVLTHDKILFFSYPCVASIRKDQVWQKSIMKVSLTRACDWFPPDSGNNQLWEKQSACLYLHFLILKEISIFPIKLSKISSCFYNFAFYCISMHYFFPPEQQRKKAYQRAGELLPLSIDEVDTSNLDRL